MRLKIFQFSLVLMACLCCILTGCRHYEVTKGRNVFESMQAATAEIMDSSQDRLILVKLKAGNGGSSGSISSHGGMLRRGVPGARTMSGVLLTTNGYAVIAQALKPDQVSRIEAWIGEDEFKAKLVKSDDQLGVSIIKLDVDEPVRPLSIDSTEDLQPGDWCVIVQAADEIDDYKQQVSVAVCQGERDGIYREFILDNASGIRPGSPVFSLSGNLAGIMFGRGRVIAMSDLSESLTELLEEAGAVKSADEEAKQKAWFGALVQAVNKEYARKHKLNKSWLWVLRVIKDGPAEKAGVREGDLVVSVNGRDMRLSGDRAYAFFKKALRAKVDQQFTVTVFRDGKQVTLSGIFEKEPEDQLVRADDLGVTVQKIEDLDVATMNLFSSEGVLVTDIKRGSAAAVGSSMRNSLLTRGDIITAVAGRPTPDMDSFSDALVELRQDRPDIVLVSYVRGRTTGFAALNMKIGDQGSEEGEKK